MSEMEHRFRSAAFGFNRQDVIQYIEAIHKEYTDQIQDLKNALEQAQSQQADMAERGALASEAATAAGKDAQRAKEETADALTQLQDAQRQREELRLRLQVLERDFDDLQKAADRMAPAARAYEALKDKAATIELDAHNRAQAIVKSGETQAAEIRQEVETWLRQVESSYARLKSDVAATLSHAVTELDRTGRALDKVTEELDSHGAHLLRISARLNPSAQQPEDHTP